MMNLRTVIVVFIMALLVHEGKADCSGSASPDSCEIWSALQDNFGGASWTACGTSATNSRYINPCGSKKCPFTSGFVTCDGNVITSFNFNSENNLVAEADISSFVSMLETYRDSYNFQTLTLQNQASLALDECLAPCADGITCDFTGSECTGSCTTDGICVTDAPTPSPTVAPTAPTTPAPTQAPTPVPTTAAPTTPIPTSAPTTPAPTPSPTAQPTKKPTSQPTQKPTKGVGCDRLNKLHARRNCNLWNSLMDAFTSDDWKVCKRSRNENPCSPDACARRQGLVDCRFGRVMRVRFERNVGLTWNPLTNVTAFEETLLEANQNLFKRLKVNRQTSLNLDTCFPNLCSTISCAFQAGSVCTGACTENGQCAP
eukprot:CAMPEP_0171491634 /NCGR_PEP_ID=MMETSP0958-20121227/3964_1 /TAXON_ID=87120 /ORGANISM="Aurantiochytrium limacinum, Strain ATCCMYA-1381" /LENGTH=371 /DNA_ID=CAMNT_0012025065 /DNA_START=59 /DNA_END=1174 /DNA_ORIENTATION=+